jgi:O-antigen ligase
MVFPNASVKSKASALRVNGLPWLGDSKAAERNQDTQQRFLLPVLLTFIPCFLINFDLIHKTLAAPILLSVSFYSFFSPYSALLFLTATQIIPDISSSFPLINADLAVIGWIAVTSIRRLFFPTKNKLEIPWVFIAWLTPFLGWMAICAIINADLSALKMILKAMVIAVIIWNLISQTNGRYDLCLLAILIGCLLCLPGFWGRELGISVYVPERLEIFMRNPIRGAIRIGSGRGDANTIYPFLLSAVVGFLSLTFAHTSLTTEKKTRWTLYTLSVLAVVLCLPAALATVSRGVIMCGSGSLLLLFLLSISWNPQEWPLWKKAMILGGLLGTSMAIIMWSKEFAFLSTRMDVLVNYWQKVGLTGGRENVFSPAIDAILKFPLFGLPYSEYLSKYSQGTYDIAHNTFLDIGISGGLPGMLFSVMFFIAPYYYLMKDKRMLPAVLPTLVIYSNWLLYAQIISCLNTKVIWCLWILLIHQISKNRQAIYLQSQNFAKLRPRHSFRGV